IEMVMSGEDGVLEQGAQSPQSQVSHISWQDTGSSASFTSSLLQEDAKAHWDSEFELRSVSRILLRLQKWGLIIGLVCLNATLIYVAWAFWQVYYLFILLLSANTVMQAFMICGIILHFLATRLLRCGCGWPRKEV